ncbi:HpcH/HpaI aldolase family protein [Pseudonocardia sp. RS010]|uniref:HpcH/HpaI aldolase family protein n=1 Tax=Pseudonocardia sp. RS010 TaxID=3385979 RepID=UPI0039A29604
MAEIRPNLAKAKLLRGEPVLVPQIGPNSIPDNDTLEQMGVAGLLDLAWIEMEHGPWVWNQIADVARTCDLVGISSLVRVDRNDPEILGRTLDRGVGGLVIPHVNTKAEAERIVEGALYAPLGARGMWRPRQSYGVEDYFEKANAETLVVATIEEVTAIDNMADILSVEGIDCIFVAPVDLSQTMGPKYLDKPLHPDVQKVVQEALTECVRLGKACGTLTLPENFEAVLATGARFLRFPTEPFVRDGLLQTRQRARAAIAG